jgi:hypothetical protein
MISDRLSGSARRHRRAATRHLPFAVAALALAVFAAHIIEQRLSARTTLAERIKECAELSLRLRARFALLRLIR